MQAPSKFLTTFGTSLNRDVIFNRRVDLLKWDCRLSQFVTDSLVFASKFNKKLQKAFKDFQKRAITEAITNYAKIFYQIVGAQGVNNYKQVVHGLNKFYKKMDNKFYSELEGKQDDMSQLAEYLNSERV